MRLNEIRGMRDAETCPPCLFDRQPTATHRDRDAAGARRTVWFPRNEAVHIFALPGRGPLRLLAIKRPSRVRSERR